MRRVRVSLPATITHLGTGSHTLGLAVGLHATVDITERSDTKLVVETAGEDSGRYAIGLRHPVVLGLTRVFQKLERSTPGISIRVDSKIPASVGLGLETTFFMAGIIAGNNLFGSPFKRAELLKMAAQVTGRPDQAVTAMIGGLTTTALVDDEIVYRSLPVAPLKVIIVLPELHDYASHVRAAIPDRVPMRDAIHNLSRLPLLIEALRTGDLKTAGAMMEDRLFMPYRSLHIPGFEDAREVAKLNGAASVTLCGSGPALLALASTNHQQIASVISATFEDIGIPAKSWVLPIDTQGVVLSVAQTS